MRDLSLAAGSREALRPLRRGALNTYNMFRCVKIDINYKPPLKTPGNGFFLHAGS
jgi:hypothetical protein